MSVSSNTLNSSSNSSMQGFFSRFRQDLLLFVSFVIWFGWVCSLWSYSKVDPAWSSTASSGAPSGIKNWLGKSGAYLADISYYLLGYTVWVLIIALAFLWVKSLLVWLQGKQTQNEDKPYLLLNLWLKRAWWAGCILLLLWTCSALEWSRLYRFESTLPGFAGGVLGYWSGPLMTHWLGDTVAFLVCLALVLIGLSMVLHFSWGRLTERTGAWVEKWFYRVRLFYERARDRRLGKRSQREREQQVQINKGDLSECDDIKADELSQANLNNTQNSNQAETMLVDSRRKTQSFRNDGDDPLLSAENAPDLISQPIRRQKNLFDDVPSGVLPSVQLLDPVPAKRAEVCAETLEMTSRLIEKKLQDFGVQVHVSDAQPGPVITRYEIEPAVGVKGSQIVNLSKDLARSLSLLSIRVVETIPGKNCMALELPNARRQSIQLKEILSSPVYEDEKSKLAIGLGKSIIGNPVVADLAKMPHCLVAGTTGSGKSVGINAMILSILFKAEPHEVRLLMIDPKMLEMSMYEGIPHLLCPVVTDMKQAAHGLNWCVAEMERRYKLMSKLGVRNLAGYNAQLEAAQNEEKIIPNPFSLTPEDPEPLKPLPHIVIVIDELADLMMVVGKKIEELIARLAQKARAAGIHLILATQRPSVDVITGLIKANIPTRIAFQVSSKIDSRTILDQMGAENLLGMGDMLYMKSGSGFPVRVHGAFVSDEEVRRVVNFIKEKMGPADYVDGVLEGVSAENESDWAVEFDSAGGDAEKDPLYDQAVEIVLKERKASISYLQRKLRIGFNRSARLLEDMEKSGLVGQLTSSGQRDILVPGRSNE